MAGSGAVGVCSSGFSSVGVSFLGSGAGFFSVSVCVSVFGAAVFGVFVGFPHAVANRSNGTMPMAAIVLLCMVRSRRWRCFLQFRRTRVRLEKILFNLYNLLV